MYKIIFYALCIAVTALSCNSESEQSSMTVSDIALTELNKASKAEDANAVFNADIVDTASAPPNIEILNSGGPANIDWDKKIIKTAHVTLELKDYNTYNNALHSRIKNYGAYIAQEEQKEEDNEITNDITIKVPVDKFEDLMNSLPGDGIKVIQKNISTEDVTGEVVDTKARIEAKKEVRARYLDLLKQAKNMKEILEVQSEINDIQIDLESAQGRVNYLVHSSAYSTINLHYYQLLNGVTAKDVEPGFLDDVSSAFKTGGAVITNLILFVISIWPLVIAGAFLFVYVRKLRSRKLVEQVPSKAPTVQVSDTTQAS